MLREFFKRPTSKNPRLIGFVWFATAPVACLLELPAGRTYNNSMIYRVSFSHALELKDLYIYYPNEYHDRFLHGIPFTTIIAPFSLFSPYIGMLLRCLANSLLLCMATCKLGLVDWKQAFVIRVCLNELFMCVLMQQFNMAIAGMTLLLLIFIERKREFWAVLVIILSTTTKTYDIVGLAFLLLPKRRIAFSRGLIFWGIVLCVLPVLYTSSQCVASQYAEWHEVSLDKNVENLFTPYINISLLGVVRKISGVNTYSDLWLVIPGLFLFIAPYLRINQYDNRRFRMHFLCSTLLLMVFLSSGTEDNGYLGVMIVVYLWYIGTPIRKTTLGLNTVLFVFCFALTPLSPTSILPCYIRKMHVIPHALKVLPCVLVWFKTVWEQLTLDFSEPLHRPKTLPGKEETADLILPCYNSQEGRECLMIEKHAESVKMLKGRSFRFIVTNDASKRGSTKDAVGRLLGALPDTMIVSYDTNKGKGAAVRAGLSHSISSITLYTDYDFPYETDSICRMVEWLESGYDVIIAVWNHTCYTRLSTRRKIIGYVSRILNFTLLGLMYTDAQGGLKGFNQRGESFLASTQANRFLFDTEFIYKVSQESDVFIRDMPAGLRDNVHPPNMRREVPVEELKNLLLIARRGQEDHRAVNNSVENPVNNGKRTKEKRDIY